MLQAESFHQHNALSEWSGSVCFPEVFVAAPPPALFHDQISLENLNVNNFKWVSLLLIVPEALVYI